MSSKKANQSEQALPSCIQNPSTGTSFLYTESVYRHFLPVYRLPPCHFQASSSLAEIHHTIHINNGWIPKSKLQVKGKYLLPILAEFADEDISKSSHLSGSSGRVGLLCRCVISDTSESMIVLETTPWQPSWKACQQTAYIQSLSRPNRRLAAVSLLKAYKGHKVFETDVPRRKVQTTLTQVTKSVTAFHFFWGPWALISA